MEPSRQELRLGKQRLKVCLSSDDCAWDLQEVLIEMGNLTEMCCDAFVEGLRQLKDSPHDLHRAYRAAFRLIATIARPAKRG